MNPFKSLKYMLWNNYKMCLIKFLVIGLLVALMGLFFYSMPVRLTLTKYNKVTRKLSSCMGNRVTFKRNCVKWGVCGFGGKGNTRIRFYQRSWRRVSSESRIEDWVRLRLWVLADHTVGEGNCVKVCETCPTLSTCTDVLTTTFFCFLGAFVAKQLCNFEVVVFT